MQVLVLDSNQLISLPSDIGHLVRLERLSVKNNALTTLPVSISQLNKLSLLDVSSNSLVELTNAVADCLRIEELNVSSNKLQVRPDSCYANLSCQILSKSSLACLGGVGHPSQLGTTAEAQDTELEQ